VNGNGQLPIFGNLGQFNYGSLGDSPALMNMAQLYPQQQQDIPSNPFMDLSRYISALVGGIGPYGGVPGAAPHGAAWDPTDIAPALGGIRG
jgi:hypothetical protein